MIRVRDHKVMTLLKKYILSHEYDDNYRLAAAIIHGKRRFIGYNKKKSHPLAARFQKHPEAIELHAELDAIREALRYLEVADLASSTLYVARLKFTGPNKREMIWGLALPCKEGCMKAIAAFDIPRVVYSLNDAPYYGEMIYG